MRPLWFAGLVFLTGGAVYPQAVVSTHSGVLNYSEGDIFFDDQPVNQKPGAFPALHDGAVMRTDKGRAEILLTPGVFLRVDENSSFKMVSTSLADTRVEVLTGSVIVDSSDAAKTEGYAVLFRAYQIRFPERGVCRINTEPGVLQPYSGIAEVAGDGPTPVKVDDGHQYFLDVGLKTERYGDGLVDGFTEWARNRSESISADNAAAEASSGDPGDLPDNVYAGLGVDPGLGGMPGIGVPGPVSPVSPVYPSLGSSRPLFLNSSIYPWGGSYLGVPLTAYPLITTWVGPVYGRWPRPYPRPIHPVHPYPPGLSAIVNGRGYPVTVQPMRPIGGVVRPITPHPAMPIGMRPVTPHPAMPIGGARPVAPRPAMPMGGIHPVGHR